MSCNVLQKRCSFPLCSHRCSSSGAMCCVMVLLSGFLCRNQTPTHSCGRTLRFALRVCKSNQHVHDKTTKYHQRHFNHPSQTAAAEERTSVVATRHTHASQWPKTWHASDQTRHAGAECVLRLSVPKWSTWRISHALPKVCLAVSPSKCVYLVSSCEAQTALLPRDV